MRLLLLPCVICATTTCDASDIRDGHFILQLCTCWRCRRLKKGLVLKRWIQTTSVCVAMIFFRCGYRQNDVTILHSQIINSNNIYRTWARRSYDLRRHVPSTNRRQQLFHIPRHGLCLKRLTRHVERAYFVLPLSNCTWKMILHNLELKGKLCSGAIYTGVIFYCALSFIRRLYSTLFSYGGCV